MMMRKCFVLVLFFVVQNLFSQNLELSVFSIPDSLKENANAVVRLNQSDILISSQRSMNIKNKRVVTVLNEKGLSAIEAVEHYDNSTSIKNIEAAVFNLFGKEVKKIKRKNFKDQAAIGDGTIFSDNRVVFLDFIPAEYPFTIIYESEIETSNTAFIPQWRPLSDYFVSVEKSILTVSCIENLGLKKKELSFGNYPIKKIADTSTKIVYVASNLIPQKYEDFTPLGYVFPRLMLGLDFFHLEGVDGNATNWAEMGKWFSDKILKGTSDLTQETKDKMRTLVGNEKDAIKKARIVYDYVQQKTRYVSIQEGIGGWKPMLAKDVDRLDYGDCKALSNYTKALLESVGVTSYYTRLYGDQNKRDVLEDFVAMQSNHVILAIPVNDDYVWLECTNQEDPFGYQGVFTDDRSVLVMKPEGGQIVRTKKYTEKENAQVSKGNYFLSENGNLAGNIAISSTGIRYDQKSRLEKKSSEERSSFYKEYWSNIGNLTLKKISYANDKENVSFSENIEMTALNYGSVTGNKMIVAINAFNQNNSIPPRYRARKNPFEISRGFYDQDEIEITIPDNFSFENIPDNVLLKNKFGELSTEIIVLNGTKIVFKRSLIIYKGVYKKEDYEEYRKFREQIARSDNSKIVLNIK